MKAQSAVYAALALGACAVAVVLGAEYMDERDDRVFMAGYAIGHNTAVAAQTPAQQQTDLECMAWWFGGDATRAGKAIQRVKK